MIGLELAKKLKDVGLRWEPKIGDWWHGDRGLKLYDNKTRHRWNEWNKTRKHLVWTHWGIVWLPSLSDLLAEIEWRGYHVDINTVSLGMPVKLSYVISLKNISPDGEILTLEYKKWGCTPEEAVGQALLWILGQEVSQ